MKYIFITLTFLLLISCSEKLENEITYFEKTDFNSGDYKIYLFDVFRNKKTDFPIKLLDDTTALNTIKSQWIFKNHIHPTSCGYNYQIMLVKDYKVIKQTKINTNCEYMTGWIEFPKEFLSDNLDKFRSLNSMDSTEFKQVQIAKK